jgi:segregation and condensation protein A
LLGRDKLIFNDLVQDMNELEVARYFIAMLYLSMKNKIEIITQATEYEDNGPSEDTFSNNASEKNHILNSDTIIIIPKNIP